MTFEEDYATNQIIINDFDKFVENLSDDMSCVLDIGFGTGKFMYRLFHNNNVTRLHGIDIDNKEVIEKSKSNNMQLICNPDLISFIDNSFNIQSKIDSYDFYLKYVELELNKKALTREKREQIFKLEYEKGFKFSDFSESSYNLIIASKVIHYETINDPDIFLIDCMKLLKNQGLLYVTFPSNSGRVKISKARFEEIIEGIHQLETLEISEVEERCGVTILFKGKKTVPNTI